MSNVSIIELSVRNWGEEDYITFSLYCAPFLSLKPFKKREERRKEKETILEKRKKTLLSSKLIIKKERERIEQVEAIIFLLLLHEWATNPRS